LRNPPLAHVDDDCHALECGVVAAGELGERRDQLRGQIVDAEVAQVLEGANRVRLPGSRKAGHDDEAMSAKRASRAGAA